MAKPQTEEGFVMIALDLFVALLTADIPNGEAIILAEVLSQCYGPSKRRSVHLDLAEIEHRTGVHRNNVRRAIGGLIAANILTRNDDGTYSFLKDWEAWRPRGKPFVERLNGSLAMFARNVKARFGRPIRSTKGPIQSDCDINERPNPVRLETQSSQIEISKESQSNQIEIQAETESNQIATDQNTLTDRNVITPIESTGYGSLACAHTGASARGIELRSLDNTDNQARPTVSFGSHQACVEVALDLFGDAGANLISHSIKELTLRLADENGMTRWDALVAALRLVDRIRRQPGAIPVRSILASAYHWTDQWIVTGEVPPEPVEAPVIPFPKVSADRPELKPWSFPDVNAGWHDQ